MGKLFPEYNPEPASQPVPEPRRNSVVKQSIPTINLNSPGQSFVDLHLMELSALTRTSSEDKGNVLAIVTFPKNDHPKPRACDGHSWDEDFRIRMSYDKLMSLGSSKISAMFRPKAQERFHRALNITKLPDGIEYVLDFTPPSEGPELADLTAMLWLPRMVKLWFLAGYYLPDEMLDRGCVSAWQRPMANNAVGCVLTLGHDDVCKLSNCLHELCQSDPKKDLAGIFDEDPLIQGSQIPRFRKIDDYCPIRHRVSIMRVLRAINGHDLLLNSAVRMWTVAQVAIALEVPGVVVDPVMQWLTAPPNTKFLEICPEKAFQLAYALKIPNVLIASFKILVSETAIDYAATIRSPRLPSKTWVQRRRDDYGDFPSDPIEYGSRALLERISSKLQLLLSDNVFDVLSPRNPEWERFKELAPLIDAVKEPHPLKLAYQTLRKAVVSAFHQTVQLALRLLIKPNHVELITAQRRHYLSTREGILIENLYSQLNDTQRALTPMFWATLRGLDLSAECLDKFYEGQTLKHHIATFNEEYWRAQQKKELMDCRNVLELVGNAFVGFRFFSALSNRLGDYCYSIIDRNNDSEFPFFLSDHLLLTLEDSELKYLPIWANGLDDGTGGVFQEVIPPAEMGPSEPGPAYHTGYTVASQGGSSDMSSYASTIAPSDLNLAGLDIDDATVARSLSAQQSVSTMSNGPGINTRRVVAAPSEMSFEQFSAEDDVEFAEAAYEVPVEHQLQGQALERYVEDLPSSSSTSSNTEGQEAELRDFSADDDDDDDGTSTLDGFEEVDSWTAEV
ncbi:hypothetical protein QBC38DRAFT_354945 [Podospora fimiseda]|uniref:Uncharacterized protein n=1 Tax=Podospora fimiseda TaxID=252190 RepID=A0AAN7H7X5_9PEZI|nr:hypothetical protein QBC38DRAFT_354945 [Podospora fimiseda]